MNKALKILLLVLLLAVIVLFCVVGPNFNTLFGGGSVPNPSIPAGTPGVDKPLTLDQLHMFF